MDLERDGEFDAFDPGIKDWTVFVDLDDNGQLDDGEPCAQTDEDGQFAITGLEPGTFTVTQVLPIPQDPDVEWVQTFPDSETYEVELTAGDVVGDKDFGNLLTGAVSGRVVEDINGVLTPKASETVFLDANGNGLADETEPQTPTRSDDPSTPQDETGTFLITGVKPGTYAATLVVQPGFAQTSPVDPSVFAVQLNPGDHPTLNDFVIEKADIIGTVFDDVNRNGLQAAAEVGLADRIVQLDRDDDGTVNQTVQTDGKGYYAFAGVGDGEFRVTVKPLSPFLQTSPGRLFAPEGHLIDLTEGVVAQPEPADFGFFHPPDLTVAATPTKVVSPGLEFEIAYTVANDTPGKFAESDEWIEQLWLTDDGAVDGRGFELKSAEGTFTNVGTHRLTVTMPEVGNSASTQGNGRITNEMILDGLHWVVAVDPTSSPATFGDVIEVDDTNNLGNTFVSWAYPDLRVSVKSGFSVPVRIPRIHQPRIALRNTGREIVVDGEYKYFVGNHGSAPMPDGARWTEQLWLGTDGDITQANNADEGIFHVKLFDGRFSETNGPQGIHNRVERVINVDKGRIRIPKGVELSTLKLIVLLDRPEGSTPEEATPGDILETHELPPVQAPPFNNILVQPLVLTTPVTVNSDGELQSYDTGAQASHEPYDAPDSSEIDTGVPRQNLIRFGDLSQAMSLSQHGRFVAFESGANNLVADDTNDSYDVFVLDRDKDADGIFDETHAGALETTRISVSPSGVGGNNSSGNPTISLNGRYVTFESRASNLVLGMENPQNRNHIYMHDRETGLTRLVSLNDARTPGNGDSYNPDITIDGHFVVFESASGNLQPGVRFLSANDPDPRNPFAGDNGSGGIYIHDVQEGTTRKVNVDAAGKHATALVRNSDGEIVEVELSESAFEPSISANGNYVAYVGNHVHKVGTDYVLGESTSSVADIFVKELTTGKVTRVTDGRDSRAASWSPRIAKNNQRVVFLSHGVFDDNDLNRFHTSVYVWEPGTGSRLASIDAHGDQVRGGELFNYHRPDISTDGRTIVFAATPHDSEPLGGTLGHQIFIRDVDAGLTQDVIQYRPNFTTSQLLDGLEPAISGNGQWAGFASSNSVLIDTDDNDETDNFVHFVERAPLGGIKGTVFADENVNKAFDDNETGLDGFPVEVFRDPTFDEDGEPIGNPFRVLFTDGNGIFHDDRFAKGEYLVRLQQTDADRFGQTLPLTPNHQVSVKIERNRQIEDAGEFGVVFKPDLQVASIVTDTGIEFDKEFNLTYIVRNATGGVIPPGAEWGESVWLIDGNDFEFKLQTNDELKFNEPGERRVRVRMPSIGDEVSTTGAGVVTPQMIQDGLKFEVRVDPKGQTEFGRVDELDDDANTREYSPRFGLPDLRVYTVIDPPKINDPELPDQLTFSYEVVNRSNSAVPDGMQWTEQIWLGTDTNISAENDPDNGVFHVKLATKMFSADGGIASDARVQHDVDLDLSQLNIPAEVGIETLKWIILLDWPDGQTAEQANPGKVPEWHEVESADENIGVESDRPANAFPYPASDQLDLSPLEIQVDEGGFGFDSQRGGYVADGTLHVGFEPADGQEFVSLLRVEGDVFVNTLNDVLQFTGDFYSEIRALDGKLFKGSLEIPLGETTSSMIVDLTPADSEQYELAGLETRITRIELENPADPANTNTDSQLKLEGDVGAAPDFQLLDPAGRLMSFTVENPLVINSERVAFNSNTIAAQDFFLLNLITVRTRDVSISIINTDDGDELRLKGRFFAYPYGLKQKRGVTIAVDADLTGDNYLSIKKTAEGLSVGLRGQINIPKLEVEGFKKLIRAKDIKIFYDSESGDFRVEGAVSFTPLTGSAFLIAGIGFRNGILDFFKIGADDLKITIPTTPPAFALNKIVVTVDNIAEVVARVFGLEVPPPNGKPPIIKGELGIKDYPSAVLGKKVGLDAIPAAFGGPIQDATLIGMSAGVELSTQHLKLTGEIKLFEAKPIAPLFKVKGSAELNWRQGKFKANGEFTYFADLVKGNAALEYHKGNINASVHGEVRIPSAFLGPILGFAFAEGFSASGDVRFQYKDDDNPRNDYIAIWGRAFGKPIGVRVRFDGDVDFLGAREIAAVAGRGVTSSGYPIPAGTPWAFLMARWENQNDDVEVELLDPDGNVYTEADIANDDRFAIRSDTSTHKIIDVNAPTAGNWKVRVVDEAGLGDISFAVDAGTPEQTLQLLTPSADVVPENNQVQIQYVATDPDSDARIHFYYDDDGLGFDGVEIDTDSAPVLDADGNATFTWNTQGLDAGRYRIYAMMDDGQSTPVFSNYSVGSVTIAEQNAPHPVTDLSAEFFGGDRLRLTWTHQPNVDSYVVWYSSDAAGATLEELQTIDADVNFGDAILTGFTPGETYRITIQPLRIQDNFNGTQTIFTGLESSPVVGIAGAKATVAPADDQWEVFAKPGTTFSESIATDTGETFALVKAPDGATFNTANGQFEWDVPGDADGWHEIVIEATDDAGFTRQVRRNVLASSPDTTTLTGIVFEDLDGDGERDPGEAGLAGRAVELVDIGTGDVLLSVNTSDSADKRGAFSFADVLSGEYLVRHAASDGYQSTNDESVQVRTSNAIGSIDFGLRQPSASISGTVIADTNANGVKEDDESGLDDVVVFLDSNQNGRIDRLTSTFSPDVTPVAIEDLTTTSIPIRVTGVDGLADDVSIRVDVDHTSNRDLDLILESPSGNRVLLASALSGSEGLDSTTFTDLAAIDVDDGVSPYRGNARPSSRLNAFRGESPNGVWLLHVVDNAAEDVGTLNGATLTVTTSERKSKTDSDGAFRFDDVMAGDYRIALAPTLSALIVTSPESGHFNVSVAPGDASDTNQFLVAQPLRADILDVTPDPRTRPAGVVEIKFNTQVTGVGISDFSLTHNGSDVALDNVSVEHDEATPLIYRIDLSDVTSATGTYVLTLAAASSEIRDANGNELAGDAHDAWITRAADTPARFRPAQVTERADGVYDLVTADLNGDGNVDALSSTLDGRVFWFANAGLEHFVRHQVIDAAGERTRIAAVDLDDDGDVDILTASATGVSWHENDGSQQFSKHTISETASTRITVGDVDRDSDVDVVVAGNSSLTLFRNNGEQQFASVTVAGQFNEPGDVVIADLDDDSRQDVIASSTEDGNVVWFRNVGDEFTPTVITSTAEGASGLVVEDLDGDRDLDVVVASSKANRISWYKNQGGTFSEHVISTSAVGASDVQVADFDLDGDLDVAGVSPLSDTISWYENDGEGAFASHVITTSSKGASFLATPDLDGDGDADIVTAGADSDHISWYQNSATTSALTVTLRGRGRFDEFVNVVNSSSGQSKFELRDEHGSTRLSGGLKDDQRVSLAGYPAGKYTLVVVGPQDDFNITPQLRNESTGEPDVAALDLDGSRSFQFANDGIILLAYALGSRDAALEPFRATGDSRPGTEISRIIDELADSLDLDGNGVFEFSNDGVIMLAHALGSRGAVLEPFRSPTATRTGIEIERRLEQLLASVNAGNRARTLDQVEAGFAEIEQPESASQAIAIAEVEYATPASVENADSVPFVFDLNSLPLPFSSPSRSADALEFASKESQTIQTPSAPFDAIEVDSTFEFRADQELDEEPVLDDLFTLNTALGGILDAT